MITSLNKLAYEIVELYRNNYKNTDGLSILQVKEWIKDTRAFLLKQRLDKNPFFIDNSWVQDLGTIAVSDATEGSTTMAVTDVIIPKTIDRRGGEGTFTKISEVGVISEPYKLVSNDQYQYSGNGKFNTISIFASHFPDDLVYLKNLDASSVTEINIQGVFINPTEAALIANPSYTDDDRYPVDGNIITDIINVIVNNKFKLILQQLEDKVTDSSDDTSNIRIK